LPLICRSPNWELVYICSKRRRVWQVNFRFLINTVFLIMNYFKKCSDDSGTTSDVHQRTRAEESGDGRMPRKGHERNAISLLGCHISDYVSADGKLPKHVKELRRWQIKRKITRANNIYCQQPSHLRSQNFKQNSSWANDNFTLWIIRAMDNFRITCVRA
jgi:hypothetical protein